MNTLVLGGELKAQFTYGGATEYAAAFAAAKAEQEAMAGCEMHCVTTATTPIEHDANGVPTKWEVFATFMPAAPPS